jgi:hypothetical protein
VKGTLNCQRETNFWFLILARKEKLPNLCHFFAIAACRMGRLFLHLTYLQLKAFSSRFSHYLPPLRYLGSFLNEIFVVRRLKMKNRFV